jgi:hypothetical protein
MYVYPHKGWPQRGPHYSPVQSKYAVCSYAVEADCERRLKGFSKEKRLITNQRTVAGETEIRSLK